MNEFLDAKDSGTAVLSHFYLLTGCAGALWLEACVSVFAGHDSLRLTFRRPSQILQYTGVLTLGVGDAIVGLKLD